MLIAPIFPISSVDLAPVTGYQLCFAELVLQHDAYAAHFKKRALSGEAVIMDTFVYEGEVGVTPDELVDAVVKVCPTYVVVPDVVGELAATMANFGRYVGKLQHVWGKYMYLVGVPQGRTVAEFAHCTTMLSGLVTQIAVGAATTDIVRSDRGTLAKLVHKLTSRKPTMLGMRREFDELATLGDLAVAMDTAKPVYYGIMNVSLNQRTFATLRRPHDFFDTPRDKVERALPTIMENIRWLQSQV